MKIITVEEHFMSSRVNDRVKQILLKDPNTNENMFRFVNHFVRNSLISNIGDERIAYMDKVGINTQIIGYGNNAPSNLEGEEAVELCRMANDELYEATQKYPGRFYGYACLPLYNGIIMTQAVSDVVTAVITVLLLRSVRSAESQSM